MRSSSRSKFPVRASRTVRQLCADGPMLKQTIRFTEPNNPVIARSVARPHKAKGTRGQTTYKAHGRLIKVGPAFDKLISKYANKKVVLHDRQTEKPQSPGKAIQPNKMAQKATQQVLTVHIFHQPTHPSPLMSG